MTNLIQNSAVFRWLASICVSIYRSWDTSLLGRAAGRLSAYYEISASRRIWERFCSVENPAETSVYSRVCGRLRGVLEWLGDCLGKSVFYRVVAWLRDLYLRVTKGSVVFGLINRLSLHQWVLVAFALYLPIGYALRNVIQIAILAAAWEELFILAAVAFILWRVALKQTDTIRRGTPVGAYILLFMAVGLLLMSLVRPWPAVAFAGYRAQVEYMIWFFLILHLIEDKKDLKVVYCTFAAMVAVLCLHGIYQYIIAVPIPAGWVSHTEAGVRTRVFSLTGSPNIFGSLIIMGAPLVAALVYYCKRPLVKFFFLCVTGMMCLCLLFTFSKAAWGGMVAAVILFSLFVDKRLLGVMGAAIAAILVAVPSITSRLTFLFTADYAEASAVGGRSLRWETGWQLLHENSPWLGFGLGRFGGAVAMNNKLLDETDTFEYFYMDNYYLKTMVEMGYIGVIFFILLLVGLIVWGIRALYQSGLDFVPDRGRDPLMRNAGNDRMLAVGIFSGLCGVLVHCYFENIFEEPYMMAYFWGLAAMLMYLGFFKDRRGRRPQGADPAPQ